MDWNIEMPHPKYPFDAPNKRTALAQNLLVFSESRQYAIISALTVFPSECVSTISDRPFASEALARLSKRRKKNRGDGGNQDRKAVSPRMLS